MSSYHNRRYKVVDGKLSKRWDSPTDGWYVTKAEAWAAEEARIAKVANAVKTAAARAAMDKKRTAALAAKEAKKAKKVRLAEEEAAKATAEAEVVDEQPDALEIELTQPTDEERGE